jgi:hypothetical protein
MKNAFRVACGVAVLGCLVGAGCGKDPSKDPKFNADAGPNPGAVKMGADARPENSKMPSP